MTRIVRLVLASALALAPLFFASARADGSLHLLLERIGMGFGAFVGCPGEIERLRRVELPVA